MNDRVGDDVPAEAGGTVRVAGAPAGEEDAGRTKDIQHQAPRTFSRKSTCMGGLVAEIDRQLAPVDEQRAVLRRLDDRGPCPAGPIERSG